MKSEYKRVILIISDQKDLHDFGREVLGRSFHLVDGTGGEQGFARIRQLNPDLIICDLLSPGPDGLSICTKLKSDPTTGHISIILLGPPALEIDGFRAGADDYILAPFDSKVLALKIKNLFRMREALYGQYLLDMFVQAGTDEPGGAFLEKLRQLVHDNISSPDFGVHEMAFQIGLSVSVLYRKLRVLTGGTVNKFVKAIRMRRAMQLLETGVYSVNEVATAVGFEDSKYFSREFRKLFGKTPMEVKRLRNKRD
ncbi:hypothetical protein GCM10023091_04160 [Ravibacter arvi]|uniref:DNA-binding response regulator n=1 Tax=Ravibacter arvi TaxID=2051041 RepID=A0ABP8LPJ4_9BACT